MKHELLKVISKHTQYSFADCEAAHKRLGSYDLLIAVLKLAGAVNISLQSAIEVVSPDSAPANKCTKHKWKHTGCAGGLNSYVCEICGETTDDYMNWGDL